MLLPAQALPHISCNNFRPFLTTFFFNSAPINSSFIMSTVSEIVIALFFSNSESLSLIFLVNQFNFLLTVLYLYNFLYIDIWITYQILYLRYQKIIYNFLLLTHIIFLLLEKSLDIITYKTINQDWDVLFLVFFVLVKEAISTPLGVYLYNFFVDSTNVYKRTSGARCFK